MFEIKNSAIPSQKDRDALELQAILSSYRPSWKQCKKEEMLRPEFHLLRAAWRAFTGPVRNLEHFAVCVEIDKGEAFYAYAEFKKGTLECDIRPEEEIDPKLLAIVEFVGQREGVVKMRPNGPCSCGSGKKAKKCCHR